MCSLESSKVWCYLPYWWFLTTFYWTEYSIGENTNSFLLCLFPFGVDDTNYSGVGVEELLVNFYDMVSSVSCSSQFFCSFVLCSIGDIYLVVSILDLLGGPWFDIADVVSIVWYLLERKVLISTVPFLFCFSILSLKLIFL